MYENIRAVAFDLDGTIYFGDNVANGALELVRLLSERGIEVYYITNSSYKSRDQIYQKLVSMGFNLSKDQVLTSGYVTALYLQEISCSRVCVIGSENFKDEIESFGIEVAEETENIDALVIGLDPEFDYNRLAWAANLCNKAMVKIIACNRDSNFPSGDGKLMPGCGAIVAAVEAACNRRVDAVVGKPNSFMGDLLIKVNGFNPDEILVVGDSVDSDIKMAHACHCKAILISDQSDELPDTVICKDLAELKKLF